MATRPVVQIDRARRDILHDLERLSELVPEMRFGQLVASLAFLGAGPWNETLWDLTDNQLLEATQKYLDDLANREKPASLANKVRSSIHNNVPGGPD